MTLTESEREWAQACVESAINVAEMRGEHISPERAERMAEAIRQEWASATRYDPSADFDPDIDPGHFDPEAADREAGWHYPRDLSGENR